jgi:hypothetical protein
VTGTETGTETDNSTLARKFRKINTYKLKSQGILKDTVGKPGRGGKMRGGGWHVFKNTITVGNAGRNGADREAVVARE